MIDNASAQQLKAIRQATGMTQQKMAARLGIAHATYHLLETSGKMGLSVRKKVLRYLGRHTKNNAEA